MFRLCQDCNYPENVFLLKQLTTTRVCFRCCSWMWITSISNFAADQTINSIEIKEFCWCIGYKNLSKFFVDKITDSLMLCFLFGNVTIVPEGKIFTDADS